MIMLFFPWREQAEWENYELTSSLDFLLTLMNTWGAGHTRELGCSIINLVKPQPVRVINDTPLCAIKPQRTRVSSPISKHTALPRRGLFWEKLSSRPENSDPSEQEHKHFVAINDPSICLHVAEWPYLTHYPMTTASLHATDTFPLPALFKGLLLFITKNSMGSPQRAPR